MKVNSQPIQATYQNSPQSIVKTSTNLIGTPQFQTDSLSLGKLTTRHSLPGTGIQLQNKRFSGNTALMSVAVGQSILQTGQKSQAVGLIQETLVDMGFGVESFIDNAYGSKTVQLIKNFQSNQGLKETGFVDQATLKALDKVAPPPEMTSWEYIQTSGKSLEELGIPVPREYQGKQLRMIIDKSEHRAFFYSKNGELERIYPVATGESSKGWGTKSMVKKIVSKMAGTGLRELSNNLWPEAKGGAFGTHLLNLHPANDPRWNAPAKGQEAHGTYKVNSLGSDASHGCVRFHNNHIKEIYGKVGNGEFVEIQD